MLEFDRFPNNKGKGAFVTVAQWGLVGYGVLQYPIPHSYVLPHTPASALGYGEERKKVEESQFLGVTRLHQWGTPLN